jgi:hypothetical protein
VTGLGHRTSPRVPQGFPLVGDAYRRNVTGLNADAGKGFVGNPNLRRPDLIRIVFDPTRLGKDLLEFLLSEGEYVALAIENNSAGTGGALVECKNILSHKFVLNEIG